MVHDPTKGYRALREGRFSQAGALYFLTYCTTGQKAGLTEGMIPGIVRQEWHALKADGVCTLRCGTIMPDHVHLLVELGAKLTLSRAVARLKSRTTSALRVEGLSWQAGYFDRRVRPEEDLLPYFFYIFLNPYRAKLVPAGTEWPWFTCETADREWFLPLLDDGRPEPAWLADLP
ncbi:MAG: transposase [Opitutae bacterium]|nr:transposase [Opitutae bacterium]